MTLSHSQSLWHLLGCSTIHIMILVKDFYTIGKHWLGGSSIRVQVLLSSEQNKKKNSVIYLAGDRLWLTVCKSLQCQRLARKSVVSQDGFRSPQVTLLYGEDGWVEQVDNGIR